MSDSEIDFGDGYVGDSPQNNEGESPPEYFVGELTSEDVVNRLNKVDELPKHLRDLEKSAFDRMGSLEQTIGNLQKMLPSRVGFDASKLSRIAKYDPELAKAIAEDLQDALSVFSMDENLLAPFLRKSSEEIQQKFNSDLVSAHHGDIDEFAPVDWNTPKTQREKDYVQWYNTVSTWEQQKQLENRGVGAVRALNAFKEWERKNNEDRSKRVKDKGQRLQGGMQPQMERGTGRTRKLVTEEDGFLSAFEN